MRRQGRASTAARADHASGGIGGDDRAPEAPADIGPGTASALRNGVIPGMDPLAQASWKFKPDERKRRMLAFPAAQAGEIKAKTGTATNQERASTSDVCGCLLFVAGPARPSGQGRDARILDRRRTRRLVAGASAARRGRRLSGEKTVRHNWVHSAATVLAFLPKERGLLKPGHRFEPLDGGEALANLDAGKVFSTQ